MNTASEYTDAIRQSASRHCIEEDGIYYGKDGALRLAREYGYGLLDFSEKDAREELRSSYGKICVICFNLKPPIDAKEWITEIENKWNSEHTYISPKGKVTEKCNARWYK